jgi:serine/threonine protein kinase
MDDNEARTPPIIPAPDNVLGLDPRAVLGRIARERKGRVATQMWEPPALEEIVALFPQFESLELIGRGGMGVVYRARQPALDRLVAIKLLPVEAGADDEFAARFQAEARALARLQHPNIVTVHDFGRTSEGHLYFVMEYVEGSDLAALIRAGSIPPARAIEIVRSVCVALEFAHAHGIVHRDIKPANVLIARDGAVKVADFGLARLRAEADAANSRLTVAGIVMGTPEYMAPEQRAGGDADARADLYSLGVLLYESLTGRLPTGAWEPPSRVAKTAMQLDAVVLRALQPEPAKRFQRADELSAQLAGAATPRREPKVWWLITAAVIIGGALFWYSRREAEPLSHSFTPAPASASAAVRPTDAIPSATATPLIELTPPGEMEPLRDLDLAANIVAGEWKWLDAREGGTVAIEFNPNGLLKWLRLPVRPGPRGYDLSFQLWLPRIGGNAGIILPVGEARTHLLLDWFSQSGMEFVRGLQWKNNETTVTRDLPQEQFFPVEIAVRPEASRASVTVRIDGEPFIAWHGPQGDLALMEDKQVLHDGPGRQALAFTSFGGGLRIRDVKVRVLP